MGDRKLKPGGLYRHFKGNLYRALFVAMDTEATKQGREEKVVVYEGTPDRGYFVRPLSMFLDTVDRDGQIVPRFAEVEEGATNG